MKLQSNDEMQEGDVPSAEHATSWWYLDTSGFECGPYNSSTMRDMFLKGQFHEKQLKFRSNALGQADFLPLSAHFPNEEDAFATLHASESQTAQPPMQPPATGAATIPTKSVKRPFEMAMDSKHAGAPRDPQAAFDSSALSQHEEVDEGNKLRSFFDKFFRENHVSKTGQQALIGKLVSNQVKADKSIFKLDTIMLEHMGIDYPGVVADYIKHKDVKFNLSLEWNPNCCYVLEKTNRLPLDLVRDLFHNHLDTSKCVPGRLFLRTPDSYVYRFEGDAIDVHHNHLVVPDMFRKEQIPSPMVTVEDFDLSSLYPALSEFCYQTNQANQAKADNCRTLLKLSPQKVADHFRGCLKNQSIFYEQVLAGVYRWLPSTKLFAFFGIRTVGNQLQLTVGFPGTSCLQDVLTDLTIVQASEGFGEAKFHKGFYEVACAFPLLSLFGNFAKEAREAKKEPIIVCTGHSMGGAVAHLVHTLVRKQCPEFESVHKATLCSVAFGAPQWTTAEAIDALGKRILAKRYVNVVLEADPIPKLCWQGFSKELLKSFDLASFRPAEVLFGTLVAQLNVLPEYSHVGQVVVLKRDGATVDKISLEEKPFSKDSIRCHSMENYKIHVKRNFSSAVHNVPSPTTEMKHWITKVKDCCIVQYDEDCSFMLRVKLVVVGAQFISKVVITANGQTEKTLLPAVPCYLLGVDPERIDVVDYCIKVQEKPPRHTRWKLQVFTFFNGVIARDNADQRTEVGFEVARTHLHASNFFKPMFWLALVDETDQDQIDTVSGALAIIDSVCKLNIKQEIESYRKVREKSMTEMNDIRKKIEKHQSTRNEAMVKKESSRLYELQKQHLLAMRELMGSLNRTSSEVTKYFARDHFQTLRRGMFKWFFPSVAFIALVCALPIAGAAAAGAMVLGEVVVAGVILGSTFTTASLSAFAVSYAEECYQSIAENEKYKAVMHKVISIISGKDPELEDASNLEMRLCKMIGLDPSCPEWKGDTAVEMAQELVSKTKMETTMFLGHTVALYKYIQAVQALAVLRRFMQDHPLIGVVGTKNSGKSTFVNMILESEKQTTRTSTGFSIKGETLLPRIYRVQNANLVDFPGTDGITTLGMDEAYTDATIFIFRAIDHATKSQLVLKRFERNSYRVLLNFSDVMQATETHGFVREWCEKLSTEVQCSVPSRWVHLSSLTRQYGPEPEPPVLGNEGVLEMARQFFNEVVQGYHQRA